MEYLKKLKDIEIDLSNFDKKEKIGKGASSKVYKICEKDNGKLYSAKIFIKEIDGDNENKINSLISEISILSNLSKKDQNPFILKFIGISSKDFKNKSRLVIITEYCSNGTLENVTLNQYLTKTKKIIYIFGIASGIFYLHSNGIIHRDLKPSNILINETFYTKISDFGISKQSSPNSTGMAFIESRVIGTPLYIAPETWENFQYSEASDVYSFSLILYEILTGKKPFSNLKTNEQILYHVVFKGSRPEVNKDSKPLYLYQLMTKCWNQDPKLRPTFEEIVSILLKENGFESCDANDILDTKKLTLIINKLLEKNEIDMRKFENSSKGANKVFGGISVFGTIASILEWGMDTIASSFTVPEPNEIEKNEIKSQGSNETFHFKSMFHHDESAGVDKKKAADHGIPDEMEYNAEMLMNSQDQDVKSRSVEIPDHQENDQQQMNETEALSVAELLQLGKKFYRGEGVEVDIEKAKQYYKEAADRGNSDAMNNYAWILIHQDSNQSNRKEAMSYFVKAVNQGNMLAMANYLKFIKEEEEEKVDTCLLA